MITQAFKLMNIYICLFIHAMQSARYLTSYGCPGERFVHGLASYGARCGLDLISL